MPCQPLWCIFGDCIIPQRYIIILMISSGIMLAYCARLCLYISITEIAALIPLNLEENTSEHKCPKIGEEILVQGGTFNWTQIQQSIVLSAFFPGYFLSHLPGGILADKYGGRHIFCLGILLTGITSFLTPPVITYTDWKGLSILRFVMGLSQGVLYPSSASLLTNWVPARQRSLLVGVVYTGVQIGSIFGYLASGLIILEFGNWPIAFYFWGILIVAWYFVSLFTLFSRPSSHSFITQNERDMLQGATENTAAFKTIPWKKIMLDPAVLSLTAVQFAHNWITYTFIIDLPKYFKEVLGFNIRTNSIIISSAFAFTGIGSLISGFISDYLINHDKVSPINMRKLYGLIASLVPGASALLATHAGCKLHHIIGLLWLGLFFMGPWFTGPKANTLDISVRFSRLLMSIVNEIGVTAGFITPYVVAVVAPHGTQEQWQNVFWIAFILSTVAAAIYMMWASGERSQWDLEPES